MIMQGEGSVCCLAQLARQHTDPCFVLYVLIQHAVAA